MNSRLTGESRVNVCVKNKQRGIEVDGWIAKNIAFNWCVHGILEGRGGDN